jgi:hypothetical protein
MEEVPDGFAWEPTATPAPERTPWEQEDASFPADLFRSWIDCLTRPSEFFESLDPDAPFARPYLFFLIAVVLGSGLGALSTQAVLGAWTAEYYAAQGVSPPGPAWALFTFFLSPFVGTMALALNTAFVHVGVRLFTERPKPIGMTARTLCYVAAPQVLALVPFIGWVVAPIWGLVITVIGVQRTHDTTVGRSLAAVLIPPIVFWFAIGMLFAMLVVFVVLAAGGPA